MNKRSPTFRANRNSLHADKLAAKLEMYRAFMTGYVKRINEATFNVPIGGVRIGLAKYTRLAQINLESRIITFSCYAIENVPERGRRYLVLHELAHVKETNHTKRFWQLVGKYEPDYRAIGKNLQQAFKENIKEDEKRSSFHLQRPALSLLARPNMPESNIIKTDETEEELLDALARYKEESPSTNPYQCEIDDFLQWTIE